MVIFYQLVVDSASVFRVFLLGLVSGKVRVGQYVEMASVSIGYNCLYEDNWFWCCKYRAK